MPVMTDEQRAAFLSRTRLGIFTQAREDGSPVAVPVWFEWDGTAVRIFSGETSAKVIRARRDPRASLLVTNAVGEDEAWVAFDGRVTVAQAGAIELAERLAERYWDMQRPDHKSLVAEWRKAAATLVLLTLTPERIRTNAE